MHGVLLPTGSDAEVRLRKTERLKSLLHEYRGLILVVVIPTILTALYYGLVASNQYSSEAHFLVRQAQESRQTTSGLGAIAALTGGQASPEATSVADYLTSHDVVEALNTRNRLVARYNRPDVDPLYGLSTDAPTPEKLFRYFLDMTKVEFNSSTGITVVQARAFTPQDAFAISNELLILGERRINSMNRQGYDDAISSSRRQMEEAERALELAQANISRFRETRRDIDPTGTGTAQTNMVSLMTQQVSAARAQLQAMAQAISKSSPQYVALSQRVRSMEAQLAAQSGRLAGEGPTIASQVAGYNELQLRQEFAAKRYAGAAASFEDARQQALKKQMYLVRVVNPNMPVKSMYPQRFRIVGTVFMVLLLVYGIGWLLVAGVREHAS